MKYHSLRKVLSYLMVPLVAISGTHLSLDSNAEPILIPGIIKTGNVISCNSNMGNLEISEDSTLNIYDNCKISYLYTSGSTNLDVYTYGNGEINFVENNGYTSISDASYGKAETWFAPDSLSTGSSLIDNYGTLNIAAGNFTNRVLGTNTVKNIEVIYNNGSMEIAGGYFESLTPTVGKLSADPTELLPLIYHYGYQLRTTYDYNYYYNSAELAPSTASPYFKSDNGIIIGYYGNSPYINGGYFDNSESGHPELMFYNYDTDHSGEELDPEIPPSPFVSTDGDPVDRPLDVTDSASDLAKYYGAYQNPVKVSGGYFSNDCIKQANDLQIEDSYDRAFTQKHNIARMLVNGNTTLDKIKLKLIKDYGAGQLSELLQMIVALPEDPNLADLPVWSNLENWYTVIPYISDMSPIPDDSEIELGINDIKDLNYAVTMKSPALVRFVDMINRAIDEGIVTMAQIEASNPPYPTSYDDIEGMTYPMLLIRFEGGRGYYVRHESSDPSVAKVDKFGRITGVANGTATIRTTYDLNREVYFDITVKVGTGIKDPEPTPTPDDGTEVVPVPSTGYSLKDTNGSSENVADMTAFITRAAAIMLLGYGILFAANRRKVFKWGKK